MKVSIYSEHQCLLGEGPRWLGTKLAWVDIKSGNILLQGGESNRPKVLSFSDFPSSLSRIQDQPHRLLVSFSRGLYTVDTTSGERELVCAIPEMPVGNRCNDGGTAPDGTFWVGTMDDEEKAKRLNY